MIGSVTALLGLAMTACLAAFALAALDTRYALALLGMVAAGDVLILLRTWTRVRSWLVVALVAGLSIGLGITFFLHTSLPGSFLPFDGGAEGVSLSVSLLAAAGYAAIRARAPAPPWRIGWTIVIPQVLFMAAGLISLLAAQFPALSVLEEIRLLCLLGLCVVVMNLTGAEMITYHRALAVTMIAQAAVVASQWATGHTIGLQVLGEAALIEQTTSAGVVPRPVGTFGDPNIAAYFFEITGPVALLLALAVPRGRDRLLYAMAAAAAFGGTVLTLSRGAWIALPLCSVLAALCFLGRSLLQPRIFLRLALLLLLTLGAAALAWPFLADRLFGEDGGSIGHRLPLAASTWHVLREHWVIGIGLNNFAPAFEQLDASGYFRIFPHLNHVVHNLHLLVWTETGTFGFAAYLSLFAAGWAIAFRLRHAEPLVRALAFGTGFGLLAHFLHGFVDPGFKLNLTISQLLTAQFGVLAWLQLHHLRR